MMTLSEAKLRASVYNASIVRTADREVRVYLNDWDATKRRKSEYFTDCLEDAVITAGAMRRENCNATHDR